MGAQHWLHNTHLSNQARPFLGQASPRAPAPVKAEFFYYCLYK